MLAPQPTTFTTTYFPKPNGPLVVTETISFVGPEVADDIGGTLLPGLVKKAVSTSTSSCNSLISRCSHRVNNPWFTPSSSLTARRPRVTSTEGVEKRTKVFYPLSSTRRPRPTFSDVRPNDIFTVDDEDLFTPPTGSLNVIVDSRPLATRVE